MPSSLLMNSVYVPLSFLKLFFVWNAFPSPVLSLTLLTILVNVLYSYQPDSPCTTRENPMERREVKDKNEAGKESRRRSRVYMTRTTSQSRVLSMTSQASMAERKRTEKEREEEIHSLAERIDDLRSERKCRRKCQEGSKEESMRDPYYSCSQLLVAGSLLFCLS